MNQISWFVARALKNGWFSVTYFLRKSFEMKSFYECWHRKKTEIHEGWYKFNYSKKQYTLKSLIRYKKYHVKTNHHGAEISVIGQTECN